MAFVKVPFVLFIVQVVFLKFILSAWSGFGWDLCHFTKLQWSGSSSLRSCKFRAYKGKDGGFIGNPKIFLVILFLGLCFYVW